MREILELYISLFIAFQSPDMVMEKKQALKDSAIHVAQELVEEPNQQPQIAQQERNINQKENTIQNNNESLDVKESDDIVGELLDFNAELGDDVVDFHEESKSNDLDALEFSSLGLNFGGEVVKVADVSQPISEVSSEVVTEVDPEIANITLEKEKPKSAEDNLKISESDSEITISFKDGEEEKGNDETDLFSLDKEEFKIEDISKEEEKARIANEAKKEKAKQEKQDESKLATAKPEKVQNVDIKEEGDKEKILTREERRVKLLEQRFKRLALRIVPKPKSYVTYNSQRLSDKVSKKFYSPNNQHLDPLTYREEYYQMLFVAIKKGNLGAVTSITRQLGIIDHVTLGLQTPLVYAISNDQLEVLNLMLKLGYNPNQRDAANNTPLHVAVRYNRIDYVTELLKFGANPSLPDRDLKLPVTMAIEQKNFKLAKLLQRSGAEYGKVNKDFNDLISKADQAGW